MAREQLSLRQKRPKRLRPSEGEHLISYLAKTAMPQAEAILLQQRFGNRSLQRMLKQRSALMREEKSKLSDSTTGATAAKDTKKLSGPDWYDEFPTKTEIIDLDSSFSGDVQKFKDALDAAKADVNIDATKRPPERAYLMHWAWKIAKENYGASKVPAKDGVDINWWHGNQADSKKAAQDMVDKYEINNLKVAPALDSRHIQGKAIDMRISWSGDLKIKDASGKEVIIKSSPHDATNVELIKVGKSYNVIHYTTVDDDKNHWSTDGH